MDRPTNLGELRKAGWTSIPVAEELRRKAFEDHAWEKIKQGRQAFEDTLFLDAKLYYEQALAALKQAGERPENREARDIAKKELREAIYQQGVAYLKGGDLDFWKRIVRRSLSDQKVIDVTKVEDVTLANGKKAAVIAGTRKLGHQTFGYMVAVGCVRDRVYAYEAWGLVPALEAEKEKLLKSIRSLQVK